MTESYKTVQKSAEYKYEEKKSEFIGAIAPVQNEKEAADFVNKIRSEHSDARHNPYAYCVLNEGVESVRFSDDGEPAGTAGSPILEIIKKNGLKNTAIVVTRYFGGILLGASGLNRAYGKAAGGAFAAAGLRVMEKCVPLTFTVDYTHYNRIQNFLLTKKVRNQPPEFTEKIKIDILTPADLENEIIEGISEITCGEFLLEKGISRFDYIE